MSYKRFDDLPVWKDGVALANLIVGLSEVGAFRRISGLRDQIERATLSVSNNIAEGFERGTVADLINFLYIAKGSTAEVRSMLCVLAGLDGRSEPADLEAPRRLTESISRQLGGWIASLRASGIDGCRTLEPAERERMDQERRAKVFLDHLQRVQVEAREQRQNGNDAIQNP